jgi:hypothetical protein
MQEERDYTKTKGGISDKIKWDGLPESCKLPVVYMFTVQERLYIQNTEQFLDFFRAKPKDFLMRIPLPIPDILNFHNTLYVSYVVTKVFTTQLHPGQRIWDYAGTYDEPISMDNHHHREALEDIVIRIRMTSLR